MTLILAPYLASPWVPVSPGELDLSSQRVGDQRAKVLADAWGESFGEAPARPVELSSLSSGDPAKAVAGAWGRENG